jgi:tetratricopeptide (TPR) repeat protein/transglutaminase-like putative cysteine protease
MRKDFAVGLVAFGTVWASPLYASDQPLYQAAPAWIVTAPLPPELLAGTGAPGPYFDNQQRFENGQVWSFMDLATRINTPQDLAQNNVLTLPWIPDKGDLIVHGLTIIRGGQQIDLIAKGQRFTVLRREESLEQRELTGILTATLPVEGLQVGDVLRLRVSITQKDPALRGRIQWTGPIVVLPAKVSGSALRFSWPTAQPVKWKVLGQSITTQQSQTGGYQTIMVSLPAPKQPEMPGDAPLRFIRPPLAMASSFADWQDVSKVMAPLYRTTGAIPAGSPLEAEVARIMAAEQDPLKRAALALRSVQDNVRYLAVGMDGGNYVPQTSEKTWSVRYGDCKAKTLLLLAMLHAMKIDAEPVLASLGLDDLVTEGLPSVAAFNHVFVKAQIGGKSYWLDGTGSGTRLADIADSPPVHNVLPVRAEGATLEFVPWHAPARPTFAVNLVIDESGSVELPSVVDAEITFNGDRANGLSQVADRLGPKEKQDFLWQVMQGQLGEGQIVDLSMTTDTGASTVTVKGRIVLISAWKTQDRRPRRKLAFAAEGVRFAPDRSRAAWAGIPVATGRPSRIQYRVTIKLPEQGRSVALEGSPGTTVSQVAGFKVERSINLANGTLSLEETLTNDGREVAADAIPLERASLAKQQAQMPRLVAPIDARRRWDPVSTDPATSSQAKAIEAVYAAAIAEAEPEETSALTSRASYRRATGNQKGALEDLKTIATKEPSVDNYINHGRLALALGDLPAAAADAEAARKLEPNSPSTLALLADVEAERGNVARGASLYDDVIALGGENKPDLIIAKASLIGEYGDPQEALRLLDDLLIERPGNAVILNSKCWIKGTRNIELQSALKDCTSAIELSSNSAAILDSRAMVWFRMGRYDDALRDLDAALLQYPALGPSRFMRALVLGKLGRKAEAEKELVIARRLAPWVDKEYARFGLKP